MQLSVGAAMRDRRKAQGWSQADLAKRAGVNAETVNRAELGANVTIDSLLKLTRALGVELELTLRDPSGVADTTVRDVLSSLTPSVTAPTDARGAPGEETKPVLLPSFPWSPSHIALYAFIAKLSEEDAHRLTRPILELIEKAERAKASNAKGEKKS